MIKRSRGREQKYVSTLIPFCVGEMKKTPRALERWKEQMEKLKLHSFHDAVRIDGEAIDFELKISQDFHHCLLLKNPR